MTLLGNILLAGTFLLALYLMGLVYGPKPPQSGDAVAGYSWAIILAHLLLLVGFGLVSLIIGWKNGFSWIALGSGTRFFLLAAGLTGILFVNALACLFKYENGPIPFPFSIPVFNLIVPALFPLVLTGAAAVLLNESWRAALPEQAIRLPLLLVAGLACAGLLGAIGGWMVQSGQNAAQAAEEHRARHDRIDQDHLATIEACDPASPQVANMLSFTSVYSPPMVRQKALEKIKSNPQWQEHLAGLMADGASLEVFSFLAYNEVDDKALFTAPLEPAVVGVADWIRRTISDASHPSHLYEDQFSYEIERVLLTLDKFRGNDVDYRPAVRAMRAALDQNSAYKTVKFRAATQMLDKWLKEH